MVRRKAMEHRYYIFRTKRSLNYVVNVCREVQSALSTPSMCGPPLVGGGATLVSGRETQP